MDDKRTQRTLNTVGKKTFVDCFEARQNQHADLSKKEIRKLCQPDSMDWEERSLATKASSFNNIFRENRHCYALKICCDAKRISNVTRIKAQSLCAKYCTDDKPEGNSPNKDKTPRYLIEITIAVFENK